MIKAMRVGNTIVCTIGPKMYQKVCSNSQEILDLYEQALNTDESNIEDLNLLLAAFEIPKTKEELADEKMRDGLIKHQNLTEWMENIRTLGDEHFEVLGIKLYMKGINITVPEFLALEFAKRRDNLEDLSAMMNFWRLCALNSDPRCREDLYKFLINNDLTLTSSGYFVAYRNVNFKNRGNKERNDYISEQWLKVKTYKKSPKNYIVATDNEVGAFKCFSLEKWEEVKSFEYEIDDSWEDEDGFWIEDVRQALRYSLEGNLQELYVDFVNLDSAEQTIYTDAHSGSTTIIIGQPVKIDRKECDANPDRTCSKGLHAANSSWLKSKYYGEVGLAVLVNPMHVVAVPYTDGGKLRCCEYLPIATIDYDGEGNVIPLDTNTFELDYAEYTQNELEEMIANSELESLKEHEIIPKELSFTALKNTVQDLRDSLVTLREIVAKRIQKV